MRFAACLLFALAYVSSAIAGLTWTDVVVDLPGLTTEPFLATNAACPSLRCNWIDGSNHGADGSLYFVRTNEVLLDSCYQGGVFRQEIWRSRPDGTQQRVAHIDELCCAATPEEAMIQVSMDQTQGVLYVRLHTFNVGTTCNHDEYQVMRIRGFLTLFDVIQTFTPPPTTLGFQVPYMPEGMGGADHFDTYWGPLTKPLDFTQAHPLACDFPATAPAVGDYLSVADTVPTPASGQGVYYVTAATYHGQIRFGRETRNGQLRGRDPAALPACTP